jgi:pimeloyl-ACP methyl ester carboxylesterase
MPKPRYPIIYVRGYAGSQGDVEQTVDDPYYGFNIGSTHVHPDADGRAMFFGFESPLVRLMKDWGYRDVYIAGNQGRTGASASINPLSIWIYRYYDATSQTYTNNPGERLSIETSAILLAQLVDDVRSQTGAAKVILVAHSMGGLVCRSLIQKYYPATGTIGADVIDKLVTFGTPHGGIHFAVGAGSIEWIRDLFGVNNSDDFGAKRLFQYLTPGASEGSMPPEGFDSRVMPPSTFPLDRVFCIVGTNAKDYDVAATMSRRTVGPESDGLVQIQQAFVVGAHRAFVHRSHSGRYGMVNSEEGYQNLQRFLFGDLKIEMFLDGIDVPAADAEKLYHAEVRLVIRQLPVVVDEQSLQHFNAIPLVPNNAHVLPLFTAFLVPRYSAAQDRLTCRYSLRLAVHCLSKKNGFLDLGTHLEQVPVWSDYMVVDVTPPGPRGGAYSGKYKWQSEIPPNMAADSFDPLEPLNLQIQTARVSLPTNGRKVLGEDAHIRFTVNAWT